MMRVGVVVGEGETWQFFRELYADLKTQYRVELFEPRRVRAPIFYYRIARSVLERDLRQFMARNDLVFFEWASELLALATTLPKTCRIVVRMHRYELFDWSEKINWDAVDKIILVSRAFEKKFHARYPAHAHKTVVIPVGISLAKFQPVSKAFDGDLGILCHLSPRKRVYDLILDVAELSRSGRRFHLHIAGAAPPEFADYDEALHRLVARLDLQNVTFYGNVVETWDWYSRIDIFVSNSYSEGMQVAAMEAMAAGRYCLAHHWDGAAELVPPENLFYTNTEFQNKVLAYYDAPDQEKLRRQECMRAIVCERFDAERIHAQVHQVIRDCFAGT